MPVAATDFLKVSFSVREKGNGRLAETTDVALAKAENLFDEHARYGPTLVMLNDTALVKGFKAALLAADVGQNKTLDISVADAFGPRQEELVRLVPLQKFREQGMDPVVGMPVTLDDYRGRVQSVSGGRVRVDLNHELAGKDVVYSFTIEKKLSTAQEKINALAEHFLELSNAATLKDNVAEITVSAATLGKEDYLSGKYRIVQNALLYIPELAKIVWKEEFAKSEVK